MARRKVADLKDLVPLLKRSHGFAEVVGALKAGKPAAIDGAWGSSCALAAAALARETSGPLILIAPRIADVDELALDLAGFLGEPPLVLPAWETPPAEHSPADAVFGGRMRVIKELHAEDRGPRTVVTSLPALLQPVPSAQAIDAGTRRLRVGEGLDLEEFLHWLVERGFERTPAIEVPGEFSVRGGIVDLFPPEADDPIRLELFGEEIDSIRRFDAESQRTVEEAAEIELTLVAPLNSAGEDRAEGPGSRVKGPGPESGHSTRGQPPVSDPRSSASGSFLDHLSPGAWLTLVEPEEIVEEGKNYLRRLDDPRGLFSVDATLARCMQFPCVTVATLAAGAAETACHLQVESVERFTGPRSQVLDELARSLGRDESVLIACHNEGERQRLTELLAETGERGRETGDRSQESEVRSQRSEVRESKIEDRGLRIEDRDPSSLIPHPSSGLTQAGSNSPLTTHHSPRALLCLGRLARGFRLVAEKLVVISDHELFARSPVPTGRLREPRRKRKPLETRAIDSFLDLAEGDLVVHLTQGIGRYRGMRLLEKDGHAEEHLLIEFRDAVKIFVPVSLIHLVQKYVGAARAVPRLSKVNGTAWSKKKKRVAKAVSDMAADMLRLQAAREAKPGIAYPPDSHWQHEFDAAFPYAETPDQLQAVVDVKGDMFRPRPMDRLICGDVGYGKTEVAMRAAFKAIETGRQVAVLVPTTVLAEQHYRTFSERMAEYPFNIEVLSRFRSKSQQRQIVERLAAGGIDVIIGTHRLVQQDVRFKDLGLLVIDEEQRFGVEAKEMLKRMRLEVDVLTMSATPIPRTLHLSLLGIRDISNLTTPPSDRQSIETRIVRWDGELIRMAIVRELNRGGQVYFVHNRVYNIAEIAERVQSLVPEASVDIAHGQMPEHQLEEAMYRFVAGKTDVLVCTTIIESGLDIPNANTIFIHQAGIYGLADLHQLRGRVGRYRHRAYCYLMLEEGRPLTRAASKRLKAVEEYSELGAGFKIAMRDLEIRGAGNILGTEQSGHIAAVGYELYCRLLDNAVRRLKNEPLREFRHVELDLPVSAFLPDGYVPAGRQKIEVYRKLSAAETPDELDELCEELRDRFGPVPAETARLVELRRLQLAAWSWNVEKVHLEDGYAVLTYRDAARMGELKGRLGPRLRVADSRQAYIPLAPPQRSPHTIIENLQSLLTAAPPAARN